MTKLAKLVLVVLALTACGSVAEVAPTFPTASADATSSSTTTTIPTTTSTGVEPEFYDGFDTGVLPEDLTLVARARGELEIYENIGDAEPSVALPETTILGTATVVTVVEGPYEGWARVMLPIRPNGSQGWITTDDVDLYVVDGRVVIDLSEKKLTYYKGGEEILTTVTAIGTSRNPTPTGAFFVTDNVTLSRPDTPWGPHALGLSGRSDTITEYNGGDGIIGIHGTNRPGSIGKAVSLGCVRLSNEAITQLHELVPVGTPVEIRA